MQIEQIATGFAIRFPKPLCQAFKSAFPSARWNSSSFCWEVGPRSGKRLESWVKQVEEKVNALEEMEARVLDAEDVAKVQNELAYVQRDIDKTLTTIKKLEASKALLENIKNMLVADKDRLAELISTRKQKNAAAKQVAEDIHEILGQLVDLPKIEAAMNKMRRLHYCNTVAHRREFEAAQEELREQREILREAGYELMALEWACTANFHRPDRDGLDKMPKIAMYKLTRTKINT